MISGQLGVLAWAVSVPALGGLGRFTFDLAAESDPLGGIPVGTLGQYGVLGVVNYILFRFAAQAYNREKDRADASDAEVKRLNQKIQDEYVGSLEKSNEALHESSVTLAQIANHLDRNDLTNEPPRRRRPT